MEVKISVLVVAHNEEKRIKNCLESLLHQMKTPDEIVVICHNCTDQTVSIAESFKGLTIINYKGPDGVPYARMKGFEVVKGDIVACIDGDCVASKKWLSYIVKPLLRKKDITLVSGYVILTNNFFARLSSLWQFFFQKKILKKKTNYFAWGSSFACRKKDYQKVGGIAPILELKKILPLHFWAEDFYLSLALMKIGKMHVAMSAKSYTQIPEWKNNPKTAPYKEWFEDNKALISYFENKKSNTT